MPVNHDTLKTQKQTFKLIFHKDIVAFILSLFFLWSTISLLVDSTTNNKDLVAHKGQIISLKIIKTRTVDKSFKRKSRTELRLSIDNGDNYFTSSKPSNFADINSRLKVGNTITVFTKPKLFGIFGMKKNNDITHLIKGDIIIIDFEQYKKSISGFFILTFIAFIVFFTLYYLRIRRRYKSYISMNF